MEWFWTGSCLTWLLIFFFGSIFSMFAGVFVGAIKSNAGSNIQHEKWQILLSSAVAAISAVLIVTWLFGNYSVAMWYIVVVGTGIALISTLLL